MNGGPAVVPAGAVAPWPMVTTEDRRAVLAALEGAVPWHWPMATVTELEHAWSEFIGVPHVLAANSGTAALHMAVAAAGVEAGDEVIVPADTFLATASCVLQSNAIPIFVDTEAVTFNIDPERIEEKITPRTRAVIAVDLNGLPAAYDALRTITDRHGLALIEDASQAHGATYKGRPAGALAPLSGASINGSKCLSGLGEGGLFATADEYQLRLAGRLLMFGEELAGQTRDYNARMMGWNYRIDVLAAAFARSQLSRLEAMSGVRRRNGAALTEFLGGVPGIRTPVVPPDRTHVYFFYPLMVEPESFGVDLPTPAFRGALERAVRAEGLEIMRWQPQPVPGQVLFQDMRGYGGGCPWRCLDARADYSYAHDTYPVAEDVCQRRLVLGQSFSSLGPPNDTDTMALFAEVFHKVLVAERREFIVLVQEEADKLG